MSRLVAIAVFLGAAALHAQVPSSYSYRFRIELHGDDGTRVQLGTVRVSGSRARVDVDADTSRGGRARGYYLLGDHGRTVTVVNPAAQAYDAFGTGEFTRESGKAFHFSSRGLKLSIRDAQLDSARLGAGEVIAGHATQRVRVSARWKLRARILLAKTDMPWSTTAMYWSDPTMPLMRNPLLEAYGTTLLFVAAGDKQFWDGICGVRERLFEGAPLKVEARTTFTDRNGERDLSIQYDVTEFNVGPVDTTGFELPTGYQKAKKRIFWI